MTSHRGRVFPAGFRRDRGLQLIALSALTLAGCTDAAGYDLDYILSRAPFISTMRSTVAYESQTMPRLPAPGSIPVSAPGGELLASFTQSQLDSVGASLSNPLPAGPEVSQRGMAVYQNQCFPCHGAAGAGNGPVVGGGKFPLGPSLVNASAAGRADGYLYGIIRVGRGLMPAYGDRISHNDRWAVVRYLRDIQQQAGGAPAVGPAAPAPAAVGQPPA